MPNYDCENEVKFRTGKWAHLVATFDKNGDVLAIYRNGILQNTTLGIAYNFNGPWTYADIGDLFIGIEYTGRLDDVILYNRVLSQGEITQLSQLGGCYAQ